MIYLYSCIGRYLKMCMAAAWCCGQGVLRYVGVAGWRAGGGRSGEPGRGRGRCGLGSRSRGARAAGRRWSRWGR